MADQPIPPSSPRASRRWRREVWVSAAVLATLIGLALALAGVARQRQPRSVEGLGAVSPTPLAADPTKAPVEESVTLAPLSGRLVYYVPGEGDAHATVYAFDLSTGQSELLWEAPGSALEAKWAISPDGTRLAYARRAGEDGGGLIYVRHLDAGAPQPLVMASFGPDEGGVSSDQFVGIDRLVWPPGGDMLYFGELHTGVAFSGAMPHFVHWVLRRITLDDSRLANYVPPPTVGPLSWGINAGEDRVVARIDRADIPPHRFAWLLAVDVANRRAAVAIGPGENGVASAIALVDTDTGEELQRLAIEPIEGFTAAVTVDGARLTYMGHPRAGDGGSSFGLFDLTLAGAVTVSSEVWIAGEWPNAYAHTAAWSRDGRWLAWNMGGQSMILRMAAHGEGPDPIVGVHHLDGVFVAFAPDSQHLLTTTGGVVDLSAVVDAQLSSQPLPSQPLSWPAPTGMTWYDAPRRVLGWIADRDGNAVPLTPTPTPTPPSSATAITPVATVAVVSSLSDVSASPVLDVDGWSPDSRWLPFWTADGKDHYQYWLWPAALNFVDRTTGAVCQSPGVTRTTHADAIFWTDDGQVAVRTAGNVAIGRPCDALAPAPESTYALPTAPPGATPDWAVPPHHESADLAGDEASGPSPDGALLVTTTAVGDVESNYITTIVRVADDDVVATVTWQSNGGLGSMGLGGEWLPHGAFLIHYSDDQGPLLIEPDGSVTSAAATLFDVTDRDGERGEGLYAAAMVHPDAETWYAYLTGAGNIRLHHPDTRTIETLPSDDLWRGGLSADGRWLMLDGRDGEIGAGGGLWIREIDDLETPFRKIAGSEGTDPYSSMMSPDGTLIAFLPNRPDGYIAIASFPEGQAVGRWHLAGYNSGSARWSPDERAIAVDGYSHSPDGGISASALFIVSLTPEP